MSIPERFSASLVRARAAIRSARLFGSLWTEAFGDEDREILRKPDRTMWSHGWFYHTFYDGPLGEARRTVVDLLPEGADVLDIASGTGAFCHDLRAVKACRVVGVELSRKMLRFAEAHKRFDDIRFAYGDATRLDADALGEFDYATMLFLLHELPAAKRVSALEQALRLAKHVVVVDSHVPFPRNAHAAVLHLVELLSGAEHHKCFMDYLARGGIMGVASRLDPPVSVTHISTFWHGCRDAVVLMRSTAERSAVGKGSHDERH